MFQEEQKDQRLCLCFAVINCCKNQVRRLSATENLFALDNKIIKID